VKEYGYDLLPRGVIVMWSGSISSIPPGWALCDGGTYTAPDGTQVTTPNLRNRFIVGAGGEYSVGNTGGQDSIILSINNLPPHTHTVDPPPTNTNSAGEHTHSVMVGYDSEDGSTGNRNFMDISSGSQVWRTTTSAGAHQHTVDIPQFNSGSTGGGQPFDNRPLYYALAFIMKL
jgi:microcystin-dependent protein